MFKKLSIAILILPGLLSGCSVQSFMVNTYTPPAAESQITIAIVDLEQETNIFSPLKTTLDDFKLRDLHYGADILAASAVEKDQIAGFMEAVKEFGAGKVEVVPIIQAKAMSGGPVERAVYNQFKKEIMDGLHGIKKIDGIYLDLHGSMGVDGLIDPEGDILEAIRNEYGKELPIGTSYDLHANMTEKKATLATFIVGYKTNPHRDFFACGYSSGKILIKTIRGEIHPTMTVNKMRLLRGGGDNIDFLSPMNGIFSRMKDMEKRPGVLSVSNFMVHLWMDEPELGWATVAVTDNNKELADKVADEIADLDWSVRDVKISQKLCSPSEAVKAARDAWLERALGIVMFCDLSDTVGTGSPGENTWLLKALMEEGSDMVSYVPVRDAEVVNSLSDVPLNQTVTVTVGGKLDKIYNKPYEFTGELIYKGPAQDGTKTGGKAVVLRNKGVNLIVTDFAPCTYFPNFFTGLGLNLGKADIVVAKTSFRSA